MSGGLFGGFNITLGRSIQSAVLSTVLPQLPQYTGVQLQTSAQSIPITLFYGTRRVTPQLIWQSTLVTQDLVSGPTTGPGFGMSPIGFPSGSANAVTFTDAGGSEDTSAFTMGGRFQSRIVVNHTGGGTSSYGVGDQGNAGSNWWVPALYALGEGPINIATDAHGHPVPVLRAWNGGGQASLPWTDPGTGLFMGGGNPPNPIPSLFYWGFPGDFAQTAWPFLTTWSLLYPGQAMAYRGTALIASAVVDFGHNNTPPQQAFEVVRTPDLTYAKPDSYNIGSDLVEGLPCP